MSLDVVAETSFRDPAGRLLSVNGRLFRLVSHAGVDEVMAWLTSPNAQALAASGRWVRPRILDTIEVTNLLQHPALQDLVQDRPTCVLEHERMPFVSFPYEWVPDMLYEAGCLTLDLAETLLADGWGLKDATPYNVLYQGPRPTFVDILSFERRDPGDPTWMPYAQFVRTFLLPLLMQKHLGLSIQQVFSVRRDGMEPEEVYRLCSPLQKLRPTFLTLVSLPTWLAARRGGDDPAVYQRTHDANSERARFILARVFNHLRHSLNSVAPRSARRSVWSDYMTSNDYSNEAFAAKQAFVQAVLSDCRPRAVLDVGCNTGHFSAIAAKSGARVVAIDADAAVVAATWQRAKSEGLEILPLVVDLARPSPALGWRNRECPAFLDRARKAFDMVLMLAIIHHLLVNERIPLTDILDLAAELTTNLAIMEFVAPGDAMFRRIARGRQDLFSGLSPVTFEAACARHFDVVRAEHLPGTQRWLYLLKRRGPGVTARV